MKCSRKSLLLTAASIALASPMLFAQSSPAPAVESSPTPTASATAAPAFDVATIKPLPPDGRPTQDWVGTRYHPDGIEFASLALPELLCVAYGYKSIRFDGQVTGLPDWAVNQKW
ncbi:MAG: hypothetical protein ABSF57_07015 [Acidobacteriaceae bacterium]|jgi:hypothetical protein